MDVRTIITEAGNKLMLCTDCYLGQYRWCEDEQCQSHRLEDRNE